MNWCAADLPVLLELQGAPGAQYYDESLDRLVDFPLTAKLRAMVDRFDENVGVSALTEAAYTYAMNQWRADPVEIAAGRAPLLTDGIPVGLSGAQVRQANQRVLDEVNNRLSDRLRQPSMKALATPIDQNSDRNALPNNRYGRMAALTGGFAKLSGGYNANSPTPALSFTQQFARDMSDGRLDEFALDGPTVAAVGERAYKGSQAAQDMALGQGAMGQRFGQDTTRRLGEPYVDYQFLWLERQASCRRGTGETAGGHYYLSTIGTVTLARIQAPPGGCYNDPGTTTTYQLNHLIGIRKLIAGLNDRMFAIAANGDVYGWGWNGCGRVGNGDTSNTINTTPVKIPGLARVVDIVLTSNVSIALTADGEVFTWGVGTAAAGQGDLAGGPTCLDQQNLTVPFPLRVPWIETPRKVAGLSNIVAIATMGGRDSVSAIDASGNLYQWGAAFRDADGRAISASRPRLVSVPGRLTKIAGGPGMYFGITRGGRVATWWVEAQPIFEGVSPEALATLSQPRLLEGVSDVVDLATDIFGGTLALRADGRVGVWGQWRRAGTGDFLTLTPRSANDYAVVDSTAPNSNRRLPRIVRLTVLGGYATALGADGLSYRFIPGTAQGVAPYWEVNAVYARVPSPF